MRKIDLNCDMGEGAVNDHLIMPFISSANIACGAHAGDENSMRETMLLAIKHGVKIGAHPSFEDRENFGRTEMSLSPEMVYQLVYDQLKRLKGVADECDAALVHVKPHGALYNMAARNKKLAKAIAYAVHDFDLDLVLFGLSGSYLISEGVASGLKTASEVFADRTYQDDGSLTPRSRADAIITDVNDCVKQVKEMVEEGRVTTVSGKRIRVNADTVCIHGDNINAVNIVMAIS